MEYKDYYNILGVARDATKDDIKRAYRKLARKYHPDISKEANAEEKFKEVGEAYEVLKDPEKRAAYDRLGSGWKAGEEFRPPPGWEGGFEFGGGGFTGGDTSAFSDFFSSLFGGGLGGFGRQQSGFWSRGQDHYARVMIDLEDAFHGATRSISLQIPKVDEKGRVFRTQKTLNVRIPKGIKPGQHIRLAGLGSPGMQGGKPGDLLLEVAFVPHRLFRVEGANLYMNLPIAPWEAALGATVKVPTPTGKVDLKVPAGSETGRKLRLKGRGIPGNTPGDLYVVLQIVTPPGDTEKAKAFYQNMAREFAFKPRHGLGD